ncbi:HNH endonuclease, partial [Escherichia coli]|nr:HNH endonuclease [Escherichia coli]
MSEFGFASPAVKPVAEQVLRAYNYECAICGFNMRHDNTSVALEAAHIKWKQYGGPCEIPNGLALCAIHH